MPTQISATMKIHYLIATYAMLLTMHCRAMESSKIPKVEPLSAQTTKNNLESEILPAQCALLAKKINAQFLEPVHHLAMSFNQALCTLKSVATCRQDGNVIDITPIKVYSKIPTDLLKKDALEATLTANVLPLLRAQCPIIEACVTRIVLELYDKRKENEKDPYLQEADPGLACILKSESTAFNDLLTKKCQLPSQETLKDRLQNHTKVVQTTKLLENIANQSLCPILAISRVALCLEDYKASLIAQADSEDDPAIAYHMEQTFHEILHIVLQDFPEALRAQQLAIAFSNTQLQAALEAEQKQVIFKMPNKKALKGRLQLEAFHHMLQKTNLLERFADKELTQEELEQHVNAVIAAYGTILTQGGMRAPMVKMQLKMDKERLLSVLQSYK